MSGKRAIQHADVRDEADGNPDFDGDFDEEAALALARADWKEK